jgi:hypothetical protein
MYAGPFLVVEVERQPDSTGHVELFADVHHAGPRDHGLSQHNEGTADWFRQLGDIRRDPSRLVLLSSLAPDRRPGSSSKWTNASACRRGRVWRARVSGR